MMQQNYKLTLTIFILIFSISLNLFIAKSAEKKGTPTTKAQLGEALFNDKILSSDFSISCASCHNANFAFADTVAFSKGVANKIARRNTPTAMNMAARSIFFFDGRATSLEEQALGPIENPDEMNLKIDSAIKRLRANNYYSKAFEKIFNEQPNKENLTQAIASFERTLETGDSEYDAFAKGNKNIFSKAALRGKNIFIGKGKCFDCHSGVDFTNDEFRNIGLFNEQILADKGRFEITKNIADLGKFKVPGLRNVAITAPYMHNGMFKTLSEVVNYYNEPNKIVLNSIGRDTAVTSLNLSQSEQNDLVAFLESLTDRRFMKK